MLEIITKAWVIIVIGGTHLPSGNHFQSKEECRASAIHQFKTMQLEYGDVSLPYWWACREMKFVTYRHKSIEEKEMD